MSSSEKGSRLRRVALIAAAAASVVMLCARAEPPASSPPGAVLATGASIPRLSDGHPDLNGTWDNGSGIDFLHPEQLPGGSVCVAGCAPPGPRPVAARARPKPNFPHYKSQFLAKVQELNEHQLKMDPVLHCRSPGVPRIGPPDKIVEIPGQIVFLYDDVSGAFWRIVPTDGRSHRTDVEDSTLGDAVGHWEGDTLVVDGTHFSDDTWLTDNGAFHTTSMHVVERMRRVGNTLEWQATVYDPQVLEAPWKTNLRIAKLTSDDLVEPTPCIDHDLSHEVDNTHHDNPR
ncbi:MAG TPA: hypothetical protein VMD49_04015 [Steroidobacteraceae bacterium]|nr:hypothetical protein [Steroidobacteraceae bacterium]